MQLISGFETINVLYRPGGPLSIKSIWNGINKIAHMIPHRRDHDVLMPLVTGEDGRDQRGGGGGTQ